MIKHYSTDLTEGYHPTWIGERPGSVHIAYVSCDADRQDAVYQGDEATVPLVAPGRVQVAQDEVEGDPAGEAQERSSHQECHLLCYGQNKPTAKSSFHTSLAEVIGPKVESQFDGQRHMLFLRYIAYSRRRRH